MNSDTPTQSVEKKSRLGELHLALVMDKEVAEDHAQEWRPETKEKIDTQARMDPAAPSMEDGGGPVLSSRLAEERNRISAQESTKGGDRTSADPGNKAKVGELGAWEHFRVFSPEKSGARSEDLVDTRPVRTWQEVDGEKRRKPDWRPKDIGIRISVRAMRVLPVAWVADPLIRNWYPWDP